MIFQPDSDMGSGSSSWVDSVPATVEIIEVGPRDGFQNLPDFIETEVKIRLIDALIDTGISRMEVSSFVHPKAVPQMRDASDVLGSTSRDGCQCFAMVPNMVGAERAIEAGADMLNLIVSASEAHNRSNVRRSVAASFAGFEEICGLAEAEGVPVRASIATSFGCPFEGDVPVERVIDVGRQLIGLGCTELNLCDTTGMANPRQVSEVARRVLKAFEGTRVVMHFHNTRGAGMANLLAALQAGVRAFEASFGGLGGCPFAPGAAGNVSTEDATHMLHEMGIATGIDLTRLLTVVRDAESAVRAPFTSHVLRAGECSELHPLPS